MQPLSFRIIAAALLALPFAAGAQGTLSTQGFGYPAGQMSTRALGTGGALSEIDPLSVTNPASLINLGASALYFQAEPEYRTIRSGSASDRSTIARYPLIAAGVPLTEVIRAVRGGARLLPRTGAQAPRGTGSPMARTSSRRGSSRSWFSTTSPRIRPAPSA